MQSKDLRRTEVRNRIATHSIREAIMAEGHLTSGPMQHMQTASTSGRDTVTPERGPPADCMPAGPNQLRRVPPRCGMNANGIVCRLRYLARTGQAGLKT